MPIKLCTIWIALAAAAAQEIDLPQPYVAARVSSAAKDGSNADAVQVAPHAAYTVADIAGPGRIVHMWFTIGTSEPDYLRTTRLRLYWDGAATPAVDVPFGDAVSAPVVVGLVLHRDRVGALRPEARGR